MATLVMLPGVQGPLVLLPRVPNRDCQRRNLPATIVEAILREHREAAMRHALSLMLGGVVFAAGASTAGAQEVVLRPYPSAGFTPPVPLYAPPFSRDPQIRSRQAVSRQLAVLDWTRWQSNAWHLYGPEELWYFGPLTFAWDFPPVEQPIGFRRAYDGRGGYSSVPIYADEVTPGPAPPSVVAPPNVAPPNVAPPSPAAPMPAAPSPAPEAVLAARRRLPARAAKPAPGAAEVPRAVEAPRRLFSW
jgi:hypothetical protein